MATNNLKYFMVLCKECHSPNTSYDRDDQAITIACADCHCQERLTLAPDDSQKCCNYLVVCLDKGNIILPTWKLFETMTEAFSYVDTVDDSRRPLVIYVDPESRRCSEC